MLCLIILLLDIIISKYLTCHSKVHTYLKHVGLKQGNEQSNEHHDLKYDLQSERNKTL